MSCIKGEIERLRSVSDQAIGFLVATRAVTQDSESDFLDNNFDDEAEVEARRLAQQAAQAGEVDGTAAEIDAAIDKAMRDAA